MLFSVEQAFVGREEIRVPLKTPAWEAIQRAQSLKRREFSLALKRRDRARVLTEIVEFIAFPFSSKLKIWSFHVVVVRGLQRSVQKT